MTRLIAIAVVLCAAAVSVPALAAGSAEAGKQKSQACAACPGPDGNQPTTPDFPRLAGQHPDYLLKALHDYKSGARKNPIMAGQVANLSAQDMADLAAFFSGQNGTLHVKR
jgi:cytochrome c553